MNDNIIRMCSSNFGVFSLSKAELTSLMDIADKDGDGSISLEEFMGESEKRIQVGNWFITLATL